jgi:hypothetical protein
MRQPRRFRESLMEEVVAAAQFAGLLTVALAAMSRSIAIAGVARFSDYRQHRQAIRGSGSALRSSCRK